MRAVAQVPIWKKEIYAGDAGCWKENKESRAPTIGGFAAAATNSHPTGPQNLNKPEPTEPS